MMVADRTDRDHGHTPVLLGPVLEHLAPLAGARILDCTLGLGGHAEALLEAGASVLGVDRDAEARRRAAERLQRFGDRIGFHDGTYAAVAEGLADRDHRFDGVLADIGVSSLQLDDLERGFSIRSDAPLDMRMGDGCRETAIELIDRIKEVDLADLLWHYGEERHSRRIAKAIKLARERGEESGYEIAEAIRRAVGGRQRRHPALRSFQALRIAVNDELGQLERLLACLPSLLGPSGRVVMISFHSLEDRLIKRRLRAHVIHGRLAEASRKVETAEPDEVEANPRAASAKLRWARAPDRSDVASTVGERG